MSTLSLWHLYLVRTASGALYTGITTDVTRRVKQHQAGTGAKALRGKGPLQLAFSWQIGERGQALKMEYRQVCKKTVKDQTRRIPKCLRYVSIWFVLS